MTMKTLASAALLALAAAGCAKTTTTNALPPDEARSLLVERNWIDHLPANEKDRLHVYRFVPSMGGGVFQDRTLFFGSFELFTFEHTGDEIRFNLLHTGDKATSRYTIEALPPSEAKGPLDLRLTIDGDPRGPKIYYGARREGSRDLDESLKALLDRP
jgi:hypothetical protein